MNGADLTTVVPIAELKGENEEETLELSAMFERAQSYLAAFKWCLGIEESYFGFGYAGIVAVFLFRINPAGADIDDWLWVVVGDVPPAYLVTENNLTPDLALDRYIYEMNRWAKAVKDGSPIEGLIPVSAPPTQETAEALEPRLRALKLFIKDTAAQHKSRRESREVH